MSAADGRSEMIEPGAANDEIEHWLQQLRADLSVDPPGWLAGQARSRWFHQRARLNRDYALAR